MAYHSCLIRVACFFLALVLPDMSHAQWVRPSSFVSSWPDSVRHFASGDIWQGDAHIPRGTYLYARQNRVYYPPDMNTQDTGRVLGPGNVTSVAVLMNHVCFVGTDRGQIYHQGFCLNNWILYATVHDSASINGFAQRGETYYTGTSRGVFKKISNQPEWTPVNTGLKSLSVSRLKQRGQTLYALTDSGVGVAPGGSDNWTMLAPLPGFVQARDLVVSGSIILAATDQGVFRSIDSGASWSPFNAGLTDSSARSFVDTASLVLVATGDGVYHARFDGSAWTRLDNGLSAAPVHVLGKTLWYFFAARDDGVWHYNGLNALVTSGLRGEGKSRTDGFRLDGLRSASFTLAAPARVRLTAHDLTGRRTATLFDAPLGAGAHRIPLRQHVSAPGMQVIRLEAGGQVETRLVPAR